MSSACARVAAMWAATVVAACAGAPPASSTGATAASAVASATPTATPTASPSASTATLADCGGAVDVGALRVVHRFATSPDDIAVDGAGKLWVAEGGAGRLTTLSPDGTVTATRVVSGVPEGVAIDASGSVYVAQQNLNTVVEVAPATRNVVEFANHTANAGIDGIAIGSTGQLLVPDSPTGQLFTVPLQGPATPRLVASGLGRPVDAAVDPFGDIVVASESTPGLTVLGADGSRHSLGHFADLDEVVVYAGLLYVTELDRRDVVAVDPATGASTALAVNLSAPQGLAVTAAGTLEIVDATTNTLYSMPACGRAP